MPEKYRIETHAHTNVVSPCGHLSPEELVDGYTALGYAGLVVTDHLVDRLPVFRGKASWAARVDVFYSGYEAVREAARGSTLTVYPGFELTFEALPGHDFLVYGIDAGVLRDLPEVYAMNPLAFKARAEALGALVFQAHPFRGRGPAEVRLLDGLEVYNGNPRHDSANELAHAFARKHGLKAISGSDAHQHDDIGRGGITLQSLPTTIHDLVRCFRESSETIGLIEMA